jgi:hypothetical protein
MVQNGGHEYSPFGSKFVDDGEECPQAGLRCINSGEVGLAPKFQSHNVAIIDGAFEASFPICYESAWIACAY